MGLPVGKERHRDGENCHLSQNHWYRPIGVVVMWQVAEARGTRIINKQASTTSSPQRSIPPCQISASIISFTKGPTPKGTIISRGPITSGYVYAVEYGSRGTTGHVAGLPLGPDANRGVHVSYLSVACWRGPCPLGLGHSVPAHLPCAPLQLTRFMGSSIHLGMILFVMCLSLCVCVCVFLEKIKSRFIKPQKRETKTIFSFDLGVPLNQMWYLVWLIVWIYTVLCLLTALNR